jgi:hypothetical protein
MLLELLAMENVSDIPDLLNHPSLIPALVQRDFVQIVRAVEMGLGIFSPLDYSSGGIPSELLVAANFESAMATVSVKLPQFSAQVKRSLLEMVPVFIQVAKQLAINTNFNAHGLRANLKQKQPLWTKCVVSFFLYFLSTCSQCGIASWTFPGNTRTLTWPLTLQMLPSALRRTTTISTTSSA